MRFKIFSMFAASLLVLGSCTEKENIGTPVQTGDEIHFGFSTPDKVDTRTVYGTPQKSEPDTQGHTYWYFPVYWEQDDEIAIFCPQASQPATQLVHYKITPDTNNPATSSAVTKIGDGAGLQWGTEDEHRFYGFYPASAVKGTETDGRIKGNIPVEQKVVRWDETTDNGGTTYNGVPDTNLAYMFAYTSVKKSELVDNQDIPLKFRPLVTILEIVVNGPAENSSPIQVSNINVTGVSGNVALAGDFECLISDQSGTCTPLNNGTVTNRISISCFDNEKNQFITLNHGDKINVKAFIIPNEVNIDKQQISITVSTVNGAAKTKTLQTDEIVAHKVNRVSLPALTSGGTNYWLSNLDPNIYLSELSLPGSKLSFATSENGAKTNECFQTQSLETQFLDGVRAFVVQTNANTTYNRTGSWGNYTYNVTGATVNEMYTGVTLESILSELNTLLDKAKDNNKMNEFAFVQITYNSASSSSYYTPGGGAFQYWIEGIEYELNQLIQNGNKYNIYTDQITPDTKLGDVGGHIVLKVNFNDGQTGMGQYIAADATIPALFSTWTKGMDDVALYWGSPNSNQTGRPEMHWYYSEATHIGNPNEAADLTTKKNQISTVFQESVDKYINGTGHNYWFMNDIGGCYSEDYSGRTTIPVLTTDLNNYAVQLLQERTQNASLGIVLLNYADKQEKSGALYQSDWLIQTIIDNNFKFALRKASDKTNNAADSDASYTSGGSVIK